MSQKLVAKGTLENLRCPSRGKNCRLECSIFLDLKIRSALFKGILRFAQKLITFIIKKCRIQTSSYFESNTHFLILTDFSQFDLLMLNALQLGNYFGVK